MTHARSFMALALLAKLVANAAAQPAGAQAEVLFRQGKDLMAVGKVAEACAAFDASQKLEPAVSTLLNLASCRENNNQLATAWGLFLEAERQTRSATRGPTQKLHQVAVNHAAKLEPRLSTLTVTVPDESRVGGLEILRNGDAIDVGAFNKALPIDGGTYKISARAPGNAEWSTSVTVGVEHDAKTIDVPKLKAAALGSTHVSPGKPPPPSPAHVRSKLVPLLLGGGAVVALGGALGFSLWGESTYSDAKAETIDQTRRTSLYNAANAKRYLAESFAVAGVGCAGLAVWLYLRHHGDESQTTTARKSTLVVSPMGIALVGAF